LPFSWFRAPGLRVKKFGAPGLKHRKIGALGLQGFPLGLHLTRIVTFVWAPSSKRPWVLGSTAKIWGSRTPLGWNNLSPGGNESVRSRNYSLSGLGAE